MKLYTKIEDNPIRSRGRFNFETAKKNPTIFCLKMAANLRKLYTKFEDNPIHGFGEEDVLSLKIIETNNFRPKNGRQTVKYL